MDDILTTFTIVMKSPTSERSRSRTHILVKNFLKRFVQRFLYGQVTFLDVWGETTHVCRLTGVLCSSLEWFLFRGNKKVTRYVKTNSRWPGLTVLPRVRVKKMSHPMGIPRVRVKKMSHPTGMVLS